MENVSNVTLEPTATVDVDSVEIKEVDYKDLTKQDLIRMCEEKDSLLKCYENSAQEVQKYHDKEMENLNNHYVKQIKELTKVIGYFKKKNKLVVDLLTIEESVEKGDNK